jgi:hypothetical protein
VEQRNYWHCEAFLAKVRENRERLMAGENLLAIDKLYIPHSSKGDRTRVVTKGVELFLADKMTLWGEARMSQKDRRYVRQFSHRRHYGVELCRKFALFCAGGRRIK